MAMAPQPLGLAGPALHGPGCPPVMPPPGRCVGRIKSFNPNHGFGFVDCPAMYERFGRDVFIHKAQLGDFKVGTDITFVCEPNKDGLPQARDPLLLDGSPPGPSPFKGEGKGREGKAKGGSRDREGKGKGDGKSKGGGKGPGDSKGKDKGKGDGKAKGKNKDGTRTGKGKGKDGKDGKDGKGKGKGKM